MKRSPSCRTLALLALLALLAPAAADAKGGAAGSGSAAGSAAGAASDEYKDVAPGEIDRQISAPLFVLISYSAIWLLVLLFVIALWRRLSRVQRELEELRARVGRADKEQ